MANKVFDDIYIQDIADAIREKNGSLDETYKVSQMGDAVRAISTTTIIEGKTEEDVEEYIYANGKTEIFPTGSDKTMSKVTVYVEVPTSESGEVGATTLVAHGDCGDNATWEFYRDNNDGDNFGTLVIRGTGAMAGYNNASDAPWYEYCESIKSLTVEKGITKIGYHTFSNLTQLENVIISHGVTEIGGDAFSYCGALKYITIPNSVTYIGTYAFSNVNNLVYILFSGTRKQWDSITKLTGNNAIKPDSKLCCNYSMTSLDKDITENGNFTFIPQSGQVYNYVGLNVKVPDRYDEGKTDGIAEGKASIQLYDKTITESGSYTVEPETGFDGFSSVIVDIADRYQEGYDKGLEDAEPNLYVETITENNKTYTPKDDFDGFSEVIVNVPERYDEGFEDGKASIKIQPEKEAKENGTVEPDEGFDGLAKVIVAVPQKTEVNLEETVDENNKTFEYEPKDGEVFKKVVINVAVPMEDGGATGIALVDSGDCGDNATWEFYEDGRLIIKGVGATYDYTGTGDRPWNEYRKQATSLEIEEGITRLGQFMFSGFSEVENIIIPNGVVSVGRLAFMECDELKSIVIPASIAHIEGAAFYLVDNLEYVFYTGTKEEWDLILIDTNNDSLLNATLCCEYVENTGSEGDIGGSTSNEFSKGLIERTLTEVTAENLNGVGKIGDYAFYQCKGLTVCILPDNIKSFGTNAFASCSKLEEIHLPNALYQIGYGAFQNCTSLTSITIPDSVTSITNRAFYGCTSLKEYDCSLWTDIPTLSNIDAFQNTAADFVIKVPAALYEQVISATNWSTYADHIVAV